MKRNELQRDLEEKLMTGKASMQEVLMELKTAAARMNLVPLPPHLPRPPSPPSEKGPG